MNPVIRTLAVFSILFAFFVTTGCNRHDVPTLQTGKPCTIQFRRDALGAGASLPISPMTGSINGADTSISGTLKHASAEWILIERNGDVISIPKSAILLIQQRAQ